MPEQLQLNFMTNGDGTNSRVKSSYTGDNKDITSAPFTKESLSVCKTKISNINQDFIQDLGFIIEDKSEGDALKLIEASFIVLMAEVLRVGAEKYSADNWKKCEDKSLYIDAAFRHLSDYTKGDIVDKDDGLQSIVKVAVNCMFLHYMDNKDD